MPDTLRNIPPKPETDDQEKPLSLSGEILTRKDKLEKLRKQAREELDKGKMEEGTKLEIGMTTFGLLVLHDAYHFDNLKGIEDAFEKGYIFFHDRKKNSFVLSNVQGETIEVKGEFEERGSLEQDLAREITGKKPKEKEPKTPEGKFTAKFKEYSIGSDVEKYKAMIEENPDAFGITDDDLDNTISAMEAHFSDRFNDEEMELLAFAFNSLASGMLIPRQNRPSLLMDLVNNNPELFDATINDFIDRFGFDGLQDIYDIFMEGLD